MLHGYVDTALFGNRGKAMIYSQSGSARRCTIGIDVLERCLDNHHRWKHTPRRSSGITERRRAVWGAYGNGSRSIVRTAGAARSVGRTAAGSGAQRRIVCHRNVTGGDQWEQVAMWRGRLVRRRPPAFRAKLSEPFIFILSLGEIVVCFSCIPGQASGPFR